MKNRYTSILLIFLSSISFEYSKNLKGVKAEVINKNYQKEYFSLAENRTNNFNERNNDLIKKSFYESGYTFEESLKLKNQFLDLFGISFKNKSSIFGFPEKRIESDAFIFWDAYKHLLKNQITKNTKITNDLDNGFNTSLLR